MYNRVKEVYKELYTKDAEFRLDVDSGSILKLIVSHLNGKRCAYYKNRHITVDLANIFGDCDFYNKLSSIEVCNIFDYKEFNPDFLKYYKAIEDGNIVNVSIAFCNSFFYPKVGSIFSFVEEGIEIENTDSVKKYLTECNSVECNIARIQKGVDRWYFTTYCEEFLESKEIEEFSKLKEVVSWLKSIDTSIIDLYWFPKSLSDSKCRYLSSKGRVVFS